MNRGLLLLGMCLLAAGCGNAFTDAQTRIARCWEQQNEQYPGKYTEAQLRQACTKWEADSRLNDDGSLKDA